MKINETGAGEESGRRSTVSFHPTKRSSLVIWLIIIYLEALQRHRKESAGNEILITAFRRLAPAEYISVFLYGSLLVGGLFGPQKRWFSINFINRLVFCKDGMMCLLLNNNWLLKHCLKAFACKDLKKVTGRSVYMLH
jgi:hypothetical protein